MAYFSTVLERLQHLAPPHPLDNPWLCCPNRSLRNMEMRSCSTFKMVPMAVALQMVRCRDHGKGAGSNHTHLYRLGTHATPPSHQFPVWKWRLGCCYQQRLLKRHTCNSPSTFPVVFIASPLQLHTYQEQQIQLLTTSPLSWKIDIRSPVQPSLVSTSNSLTTLNLPYCLPARSRLDFSSIPAAVPRNVNITSPDMNTLLTQ